MAQTITIWEVPRPEPVPDPDFSELIEYCSKYLDAIETDSEYLAENPIQDAVYSSDIQHKIREAALEAIYGEDVWEFINERLI